MPDPSPTSPWPRRLFLTAGIYGLIALAPQYFLEKQIGVSQPPAIAHPEYFYGFLGVGIAWQVAFLVIATDPPRYRPLMIACVLEKFSFAVAVPILFAFGRVPLTIFIFATIDGILGMLFFVTFVYLGHTNSCSS